MPAAAISGAVASTAAAAAEVTSAIVPPPRLPVVTAPVITMTSARSAAEIDLQWTSVSGALGYVLEDSIQGSNTWTIVVGGYGNSANFTGTTATLDNLSSGTTYWFRVCDFTRYGSSNWSNATMATTFTAAPTVQVTGEYQTEIDLSWNAVPGAKSYTVQVGNGTPFDAAGPTDDVYGLSPGTSYTFTVTAYDSQGGASATQVTGTTLALPPSFTVRDASASELDVNWNAVSGPHVSYQISVAT